jgi:hypothetical protein
MIKFGLSAVTAAALFLCGLSASASATTIYTLSYDGCTGSCGAGPFGTVALDQTTPTTITVTVTLRGSERFAGSGAGDALEFNVQGGPILSNIPTGFAVGPSPDHASTFGWFLESVTCTACQGANIKNPAGPLSFTVSSADGLTPLDFQPNANGYYFASDIVGQTGNTGNVGAANAAVPEPASLALLALGLCGFAFVRRHRA